MLCSAAPLNVRDNGKEKKPSAMGSSFKLIHMSNVNAPLSTKEAINALGELLRKVHKPYAGAQFRFAFARGDANPFLTASILFHPAKISCKPTADYGKLVFVEEWRSEQFEALRFLTNILSGPIEIEGFKMLPQFSTSYLNRRPSPSGAEVHAGWELTCHSTVRDDHPAPLGSIVASGLRPYLGANQAIQDRIFDTNVEGFSHDVPSLGCIRAFLPDTRARLVSAMWIPGKLRVELEVNIPAEEVELQIVHLESGDPWQKHSAFTGTKELAIPDDAEKLMLLLVHDSGELITQIQLTSLYQSFGRVDRTFAVVSSAEKDLGQGENEEVEYKPFIFASDKKETEVVETVVAFANTRGGRLYLGVQDSDGAPLGDVELRRIFKADTDQALEAQVTRARWLVTNRVVPVPRFSIEKVRIFGEPVVAMTVQAGIETPYATRSNQIFVRHGANNFRATPEELRALMNLIGL